LGTNFFAHRTPSRAGDAGARVGASEIGLEGLEHQQAVVLDALRRAAGAPVSYGELRAAGVELPASVVSELELTGVAIERCFGEDRGASGVRLDPAKDPAARPMPDPAQRAIPTVWSGVDSYQASSLEGVRAKPFRVNPRRRVLAFAALLTGIAAVSAAVAIWAPGGDRAPRTQIAKRPHTRVVVAAAGARPPSAARSTHAAPSVPVSPVLATELEAQGHSLLEDGRYGEAVPVLKRAVLATRETLGACLDPASSTCLTYAYALYDLGRAMRLSGQPQAAVPILERRLQIDNQRPTVGAQLQLARQGIG
jgi:Tetratricopeptide repeat